MKVRVEATDRIVAGNFCTPNHRVAFSETREKTPAAIAVQSPEKRLIFQDPLPNGKIWLKSPARIVQSG